MSIVPRKCCRSLPRCASCPVVLAQRRRSADTLDLFSMLAARRRELPPVVAEQLALLDAARTPRNRFERGANPSHSEPMVAECFTSTERSGQTA